MQNDRARDAVFCIPILHCSFRTLHLLEVW